jgi:hypothetical protein
MQCKRQDLVDTLRRAGFAEAAREAQRILPDPVEFEEAAEVLQSYGITQDEMISQMGGSP